MLARSGQMQGTVKNHHVIMTVTMQVLLRPLAQANVDSGVYVEVRPPFAC